MSPTQRTLKWLRNQGYTVAVVERWNPYAKVRQDLFGFIDLVAIRAGENGVLAVQCTSGANHALRRNKIAEIPLAQTWLDVGCRIQIISWSKRGPRGKRKEWTIRVEDVE